MIGLFANFFKYPFAIDPSSFYKNSPMQIGRKLLILGVRLGFLLRTNRRDLLKIFGNFPEFKDS
jgi:hypothetical protein